MKNCFFVILFLLSTTIEAVSCEWSEPIGHKPDSALLKSFETCWNSSNRIECVDMIYKHMNDTSFLVGRGTEYIFSTMGCPDSIMVETWKYDIYIEGILKYSLLLSFDKEFEVQQVSIRISD